MTTRDHGSPEEGPTASWLERFRGTSEMGRLAAELDWAATPLGPPDTWPQPLRTVVSICLTTRFPMMLVWGPDLIKLYNDAYVPMLGSEKHPHALGAPAKEIWPEIWSAIGPQFEQAMTRGVASWNEHQRLDLFRNGYLEECYFTYSYSPIPDEDGTIGGVLDTVSETTGEVLNRRRLECVGGLSAELGEARQVTDVCIRAVTALAKCSDDVTSAEIHLRAGDELVPVATSRQDPAQVATAASIAHVEADDEPVLLDEDWEPGRPARRLALPIGDHEAGGVLVVGLSPVRPFDDGYRSFVALLADTIGAALRNAYRRSVELGEQRHISETLQNAMLVPAADIPTVAARYLPAVGNLSVGGDWYDVLQLPDGRRALVVGDCVGHGLTAATAMGQLRTASRALLMEGHGPREVLEAMDRFAQAVEGAICATMVCAIVDLRAHTVTYSSAGHPPPLVVHRYGSSWMEGGRGLPLAVSPRQRTEAVESLREGDLIVLYTDGLVERRFEDLDVGLARLRDATERLVGRSVQGVADGLLHELGDPDGRDDVALVVKRVVAWAPPEPTG